MCRLLGYATAVRDLSLIDVLGEENTNTFRGLAQIHNDGWGTALLATPGSEPYVRDGGAPSPETGSSIYKTTIAAHVDDAFPALAKAPARSALWHLRLASSHLPLIMENQQPFYASGLSFIHNGDISDDNGRNIVTNRSYPVDRGVVLSTGGLSDSAIFFAVILEYIGFGFPLDEAVAQAVRELRQSYPKSSYNCMIQSEDQLIALCAAGRDGTADRVKEIYEAYGRGEQAHDYRVVRYRELADERGNQNGVVVASSGFSQPESEGWQVLANNQMIVASNRNGSYRVRSI